MATVVATLWVRSYSFFDRWAAPTSALPPAVNSCRGILWLEWPVVLGVHSFWPQLVPSWHGFAAGYASLLIGASSHVPIGQFAAAGELGEGYTVQLPYWSLTCASLILPVAWLVGY